MDTQVRHDQSWHVTVHRQGDDPWPEQVTAGRDRMRPETVTFVVKPDYEHALSVMAFGPRDHGGFLTSVRYPIFGVPQWLSAIIDTAREKHGLAPENAPSD